MQISRDSKGRFAKGNKGKTLNTGRTHFVKGQLADEKHHFWKGDAVGYHSLHDWIKRKLGTPNTCVLCGDINAKKYCWANKSGEYKRELSDWLRLCYVCHNSYDDITNKGWKTRRSNT